MRLYITLSCITRITETTACLKALAFMHNLDDVFFNILYSNNCPAEGAIHEKEFNEKIVPLITFPHYKLTKIDGTIHNTKHNQLELKKYIADGCKYDGFCWLESDVILNPDWLAYITKLYADWSGTYKIGTTTPIDLAGTTSRMYRKKALGNIYKTQTYVSGNMMIWANDVCKILPMKDEYWISHYEHKLGKYLLRNGYINICTTPSHGWHVGIGASWGNNRMKINNMYNNFTPAPEIEEIYRPYKPVRKNETT